MNSDTETELRRALDTLAQSHDAQKKAVSLNFTGEGKREVRVGYVVENPIWKTSYRLQLDKKAKPLPQSSALADNPPAYYPNPPHLPPLPPPPIPLPMNL